MESKVAPAKYMQVIIASDNTRAELESHAPAITTLARARPLKFLSAKEAKEVSRDQAKTLVLKDVEVILPLEGMIDRDEEKSRLLKEIEAGKSEITRIESLLANESFISKAPDSVVEKERRKLTERKDTVTRLEERLAGLG
jgi:valyl-tRNA synthetase